MSHEFEGKTCCERVKNADIWSRAHGLNRCGKPAKGLNDEGKPACGVHLAAERKRNEAHAASVALRAEERAYRDEVEATLAAAAVTWKGCSFENKTVTLEWAELQRLIHTP